MIEYRHNLPEGDNMVMRRRKSVLALTMAALSSLFFIATGSSPAHAQSAGLPFRAALALHYLATQQEPDGSIVDFFLGHRLLDTRIRGCRRKSQPPRILGQATPPTPTWHRLPAAQRLMPTVPDYWCRHWRRPPVVTPTNFGGQNTLGLLEGPGGTAGGFYDPATGDFFDHDGVAPTRPTISPMPSWDCWSPATRRIRCRPRQ